MTWSLGGGVNGLNIRSVVMVAIQQITIEWHDTDLHCRGQAECAGVVAMQHWKRFLHSINLTIDLIFVEFCRENLQVLFS